MKVMRLVLAGHETTALALTWTWYLLAEHPQVEARLVDPVCGPEFPLSGGTPQRGWESSG
jgi:cytochrome P450